TEIADMDQTASPAQSGKLLGPPVRINYDGGVYIGMKKLVLIPIVLAVMVLAGFPLVFASHSTPFNGSFSGSFTMTSQTTATITGTGQLEHLGTTTFVALATVTGPASCQGGFTATEQDTFIAATVISCSARQMTLPVQLPQPLSTLLVLGLLQVEP